MSALTGRPAVVSILLIVGGVVALGIALVAALFAAGIDGRPDDVILYFGSHQVGGVVDPRTAAIVAFVFGTGGVVCVRKGWGALTQRSSSGAKR